MKHDSPVGDPIPDLSDEQYRTFREFIVGHCGEDTCSVTPVRLASVLARDKPATLLQTPPEIAMSQDDYLISLINRLGLSYREVTGISGYIAGRSSWWLDLLPTTKIFSDAYHKRLGVVFGYPRYAVENFINGDSPPSRTDLVSEGEFEATEIAYSRFVFYACSDDYEKHIAIGKRNRTRIHELATEWNIPELDSLADDAYNDEVTALETKRRQKAPTLTIDFDWKADQIISGPSRN